MEKLLRSLATDFPQFSFVAGKSCVWSPLQRQVTYVPIDSPRNKWGMLHELGHALLDHQNFSSDADLLRKEVQAWTEADSLAATYGLHVPQSHVQDCLDTYRDWLHKRSTCPACGSHGLQEQPSLTYHCPNCYKEWRVSSSRLCRPYRLAAPKNRAA